MKTTHLRLWWRELWSTRWKLLIVAIVGFFAVLSIRMSGTYADTFVSISAPDLILDYIGSYDVSIVFVWFFLVVMYALFLYPLIFQPKMFYYSCALIALFTFVRSGFSTLTHLYAPASSITAEFPALFGTIAYSNDLFFSGHVGLPFLGFLMFRNLYMKGFFLVSSLVLGASTLLMHQHYSIDVFAAFFITYGVYVLGNKLFKKIGWMPEEKK